MRPPVPRNAGNKLTPHRIFRLARDSGVETASAFFPTPAVKIRQAPASGLFFPDEPRARLPRSVRLGRARASRREAVRPARVVHGLPARLREQPARERTRLLRVGAPSGRLLIHAPLRRRAGALRYARRRKHLLRHLPPALRLLPELPDQSELRGAEDQRGDGRATGGDDARAPGEGLPQNRGRVAHALRASGGGGGATG